MIDFRYHVVSIVAVFLALALGLFLGSTTLQGPVLENIRGETKKATDTNKKLRIEVDALRAQIDQGEAFNASVAQLLLPGRLQGETVALVSAPGVSDTLRNDVVDTLELAGATVSADVRLKDGWVDPRQQSLLGTLANRLAGDTTLPKGTPSQQAAAQLASVLAAGAGAPADQLSTTLAAYSEAQLLTTSGPAPHSAALAVVLVADPATSGAPSPRGEASRAVLDVASALDAAGTGTAIAGPAEAAADGGVLADARGDGKLTQSVSTVDSVNLERGRVALVFALLGEETGQSGNYGSAAGAKSPLASPSPSASP